MTSFGLAGRTTQCQSVLASLPLYTMQPSCLMPLLITLSGCVGFLFGFSIRVSLKYICLAEIRTLLHLKSPDGVTPGVDEGGYACETG